MRTDRKRLLMKSLLLALTVSIVMGAWLAPAAAQTPRVVLHGRVQWIAAQTMMILSESGGLPVNVDLIRVPLEQYAAVTGGTRVAVDGFVSYDGRRVIATSVVPMTPVEGSSAISSP